MVVVNWLVLADITKQNKKDFVGLKQLGVIYNGMMILIKPGLI